jgi:YjbE family integral membrane protein
VFESVFEAVFWVALLKIIGVNIILSGDNAVVIALACRSLPPKQQKWGVALGAGVAVVLRIIFTIFIAYLLTVPYLKLVGGLLLFWVGYKLMVGDEGGDEVDAATNLWHAVRIVVIADAVMSLDNVIAVAAAAQGDYVLLVLGLLISIPLVVYGATLLIKLIERFPVIVPGGAALIGFIGGEVVVTDPAFETWIEHTAMWLHDLGPLLGAVMVVIVGRLCTPVPAVTAGTVAQEAAGGAALFVGRVVLTRLAILIFGAVAYSVGDATSEAGEGTAMQVMHGLRPIFAAVIAIVLGEAVGWLFRRVRGEPAADRPAA